MQVTMRSRCSLPARRSTLASACGVAISSFSSRITRINSFVFFSSRRRHTRFDCDWSSDVCSSDLHLAEGERSVTLQQAQALPQTVSGDAAADGVEVPHHVIKGGPFLLEIERLDHFKEISGSIQNGVQGEKSNVKSDSRSLAWLTSEIPNDGFGESARSIIPTVQRSWRSTFTFNFAATASGDPCPRSRRLAGAIGCRASDHRSGPRRTCRAHRTR